MNARTVPFAGVAQRREHLSQPGDAGSLPVPRSIKVNAPRVPIDTGPLQVAFVAACAGTIVLLAGVVMWGLT